MKRKTLADYESINYVRFKYLFVCGFRKSYTEDDELVMNAELVLRDSLSGPGEELVFRAHRLAGLKLDDIIAETAITLEVSDIVSWQRQNQSYRVADSEGGNIQFSCEYFDFEVKKYDPYAS